MNSETVKHLKGSYLVIKDLYSIYESAGDTLALELRFLGEFQTSSWLILHDLDSPDKMNEYYKAMKYWNVVRKFNAYVSNAAHDWWRVKEKLEARRAQGYKTAKGDRNTTYEYLGTLTWDIDSTQLHASKVVESREQAISVAKALWREKLEPFFESIGMFPRFVLFTGGGVQLKFKGDDLYPTIEVLSSFDRLLPAINAIVDPDGSADNIFDPARIVRAPFTINWGYKNTQGETIPLLGAGIKRYKDSEVNFEELAKAIEEWAEEHGITLMKRESSINFGDVTPPLDPSQLKMKLKRLDAKSVYELLAPIYISGHQNDLLVRLFSVLAASRVDIFSALELLAYFVHDPKNTPDHIRNRLDHLTYAYGRVYSFLFKTSIEEVYGPGIYQHLANFYNSLVKDLRISYDASDFERGLELGQKDVSTKIALWPALAKKIAEIVSRKVEDPREVRRIVRAILHILKAEIYEAPTVGGGSE